VKLNPTFDWLKRCRLGAIAPDGVRSVQARHRDTAASARRAFTLIEMILAIGIAAIVLICVNVALYTSLHLRDATADMVDAESPVDSTVSFLKRDLECCVTPTNGTSKVLSGDFRAGPGITSAGVSGDVAIEMYTATGALSDNEPWADIQRVTYELKTPADLSEPGKDLYRSVVRNLLAAATPEVDDQFLLSGVSSIKFTCFDGTLWQETWDTTSTSSPDTNLPVAVRVDIQMAGNAAAQPVEIVVPIDAVARTNAVLASAAGG
jgi:prepilin-type N-terminal cleavage/methylation domain-containing protein